MRAGGFEVKVGPFFCPDVRSAGSRAMKLIRRGRGWEGSGEETRV